VNIKVAILFLGSDSVVAFSIHKAAAVTKHFMAPRYRKGGRRGVTNARREGPFYI
jgi:hypothetical protein